MGAIGGRTLAAVLLALGLLTSACTGDDPPPPTPTTSSSDPTTPAPTTSAPPEPETPQAFIRRWVEADITMQNSGDSDEFLSLSSRCRPCNRLADLVTGFYTAGGYVRTEGWNVLRIDDAGREGRLRLFMVQIQGSPTEYKESADGEVKRLPGERTQYQFTLRRQGPAWLVTDYIEVAS